MGVCRWCCQVRRTGLASAGPRVVRHTGSGEASRPGASVANRHWPCLGARTRTTPKPACADGVLTALLTVGVLTARAARVADQDEDAQGGAVYAAEPPSDVFTGCYRLDGPIGTAGATAKKSKTACHSLARGAGATHYGLVRGDAYAVPGRTAPTVRGDSASAPSRVGAALMCSATPTPALAPAPTPAPHGCSRCVRGHGNSNETRHSLHVGGSMCASR